MPPRRRGNQAQREAAVAVGVPVPDGVPTGVVTTAQTLWAWLWENKAVSSALVALLVLVVGVLLLPSDATLVARSLSSRTPFPMPTLVPFVERREMALIVDAIEQGIKYIVVDGGNGVGKSISVEVTASRLSGNHSVLWDVCSERDTAATVLRRLLGLDTAANVFTRATASIAKLQLPEPPFVAEIRKLVLSTRCTSGSEPVFVVEMAERLEVKELKTLLDFAKELADKRHGRFIFVFSPTDKLDAICDFGSLSRAEVIHVGDLSQEETTTFLTRSGCDKDQAVALYALIGGHLPHLVSRTVRDYCRGTVSLDGVESELIAEVGAQVKKVDREFGIGSACDGLCSILTEKWPNPEVLDMLLKKHLIVADLKKGVYVDSQIVRLFANTRCTCSSK